MSIWYIFWVFVFSASISGSYGQFCSFDSCYDGSGKAKPCIPPPVTVSSRKNISVTNTCGQRESEQYCSLAGSGCSYCNANNGSLKHPVNYLVDGDISTWWQSQTWWDSNVLGISTIKNPLQVNITLSFGTSYLISGHIQVTFDNERPRGMMMERSIDDGHTWIPLQFFAKRCDRFYKMPTENSINAANPFKVQCTEKYSTEYPRRYGRVKYDGGSRYQVCDFMSAEVQSGLLATNVRIQLDYPPTDGLELGGNERHMRKYYYAISEIEVTGRCDCNGHAKSCKGAGMDAQCLCEHNAMGRNCEQCKPLFNNRPWQQANKTHGNECQECHCNNRGGSCVYNSSIAYGLCKDCRNNTEGDHCEKCVDKFYRDLSKPLNHLGACTACDCFPDGIINNGSCLQNATSTQQIGQCSCKAKVFGRRCDQCKPGHWGYTLPPRGECRACNCTLIGTTGSSVTCHQTTGQCNCKDSIQGQYCDECKNDYYRYPLTQAEGCRRCPCDLGGAYPGCNKQTGSCHCRHGVEGHHCTMPLHGRFYPALDYLLFEGERANGNFNALTPASGMGSAFTGRGYAQLSPGQSVHFSALNVSVTHAYMVIIRYSTLGRCTSGNMKTEITGSNVNDGQTVPVSAINKGSGHAGIHPRLVNLIAGNEYNITVTYSGPGDCKIQIDSLVLVPNVNTTRVFTMSGAQHQNTLLQCLTTRSALATINTEPSNCSRLVFSAMTEIYNGTLKCECDATGSINASQCIPYGGQCYCKPGVGGKTCNHCLPGYHGFASSGCTRCGCTSAGSVSSVCNVNTGLCKCKKDVMGSKCDQCKANYFNIDVNNPQGCQSCFGYGHATGCTSASGFVQAIVTTHFDTGNAVDPLQGWIAKDTSYNALNITSFLNHGLSVDSIHKDVYLEAPHQYLGNKLSSYGQTLDAFLDLVYPPSSSSSPLTIFVVEGTTEGFNFTLPLDFTLLANMTHAHVTLDEEHVTSPANMTSFQFQSVLANLKSLRIHLAFKPTFNGSVVIKNISLSHAVEKVAAPKSQHVEFVENATCHQNYTGLSCEKCSSGYKREVPFSNPFGRCVLCSCNGRSTECHGQGGNCTNCKVGTYGDRCQNCQNNVLGPDCTTCQAGYWGLSHTGCTGCNCHTPGTWYSNSTVCNKVTGRCACNATMNVNGPRCDRCKENAYNASQGISDCRECSSCYAYLQMDVHQLRPQVTQVDKLAKDLTQHPVMQHGTTFKTRLNEALLKVRQLYDKAVVAAKNDSSFAVHWRKLEQALVAMETMVQVNLSSAINTSSELGSEVQTSHGTIKETITQIVNMVRNGYRLLNTSITQRLTVGDSYLDILDDIDKGLVTLSRSALSLLNSTQHDNATLQVGIEYAVRRANLAGINAQTVQRNHETFSPYLQPLLKNTTSTKELGEKATERGKERLEMALDLLNDTKELQSKAATPNPDNSRTVQELAVHSRDVVTKSNNYVNQSITLWVSSIPVMDQVYSAIDRARGLVAVCAVVERNTTAQRSSAELAHEIANNATGMASRVHQEALHMKDVLKNFVTKSIEVELRANRSLAKTLNIEYQLNRVIANATTVNASIHDAVVASKRAVDYATKTKDHAEHELEAITKAHGRAERLKRETKTKEELIANQTVRIYIKQEIEPVQNLCQNLSTAASKVSTKAEEALRQANETNVKGQRIIEQVTQASNETSSLSLTSSDSSLTALKAEIARIQQRLKSLNLTADITQLKAKLQDHKGKYDIQKRKKDDLKAEIEKVKRLFKSFPAVTRQCS